MKILVNTPSLDLHGGVANHYKGLIAFWTDNVIYNTVGKRNERNGSGRYWLPWDLVKFIFRLITLQPDVVMVNPSLGASALKRDFIFIKIARALKFKTVAFIHGFNLEYAEQVNKKWVRNNLNQTELIFVLANAFKKELLSWGITTSIVLTTTKVNDKLLEGFSVSSRTGNIKHILFLSRIEKAKGIYEAVRTYEILKKKFPSLTMNIVGDGSELQSVKEYVARNKVADVHFTGSLSGKALINEFVKGDLYLFPSYGEGMPTSVLEAMAFGLPVFTRHVGGLNDFFEDGKMGYITDSLNPIDFANAMIPYIENPELTKQVAHYNAQYARTHFMASNVAKQIETVIKKHIDK